MSEVDVNGAVSSAGTETSPVQEKPAGPGAQLAAQREAQGWTVEQVANQLNMASRQIQALESNNYAALPGMVVVRGFLRSYAKLLKMDPTPLLAMVTEGNAAPVESIELKRALSAAYTESSLPPTKKSAAPSRGLVFAACLVALVAAGWVAYQNGMLHVLMPVADKDAENTSQAASSASVVSVPPPVNEAVQPPVISTPAAEKPSTSTTVDLPAPAVVLPAAPAATTAPAVNPAMTNPGDSSQKQPAADPMSAPVNGKNSLVLTVHQDAWVEIKRADKVVLVSRLLKAGSTTAFDVTQPVALTIGNAAGVDVSLRGKPLDMKAAKNNVIRLDVK